MHKTISVSPRKIVKVKSVVFLKVLCQGFTVLEVTLTELQGTLTTGSTVLPLHPFRQGESGICLTSLFWK